MLQNLIRRDPPSYREEFILQYRHYESQRDIFMSQPDGTESETFSELIGFMSQVASSFPDLTQDFPSDLARLLLKGHAVLNYDLREKLVQSLVLLRNKDVIPSTTLLQTLFPVLTTTQSKALRSQIYTTVVSDIRNANSKTRNHRLNKTVQTVLFGLVEAGKDDPMSTSGLWAVKLTRELWKRRVWDDARTVEIMKEASLSANPKIMSGSVRFFLGVDQEMEEAEDSDDDNDIDLGKVKHQAGINKKTNKKKRKVDRAYATVRKVCLVTNYTLFSHTATNPQRISRRRKIRTSHTRSTSPPYIFSTIHKALPKTFSPNTYRAPTISSPSSKSSSCCSLSHVWSVCIN